ncbi:MAG: SDR family NAD(P)-dependent oxidoreductase [Gemmatimonadota bacterium]
MDLGLAGKVVLVGGSSRGIGRAIARSFLSEGASVVITARGREALEETRIALEEECGSGRVLAVAGNLADGEVIGRVLERTGDRWGEVDCLVANVGSGAGRHDWELDEEEWQRSFEVNLSIARRMTDAVMPAMVRAGRGSVIFVSSIAGVECVDAPLPYATAKAALMAYARNLARRVGRKAIRVNCLAPGNILFPGGAWDRKQAEDPEAVRSYIEREVPLGRFGTPQEIADLVVFLASERASFVTGACVVADGGQTRGL